MTAPDQALIAALADAPATPGTGTDNTIRVGTVESNSPSLTVSLQGGTVVTPGFAASFLAQVGDTVSLIRQDNTWAVLGKVDPGSRPSYFVRRTLAVDTATPTFSNIPTTLRRLRITCRPRTTYAGFAAESWGFRLGGDAGMFYCSQSMQSNNGTAPISVQTFITYGYLGVITGASAAGGFNYTYSVIDFPTWDRPTTAAGVLTNNIGCLWQTYACAATNQQWYTTGGTLYFASAPFNSIQFVSEHGSLFQGGCDFQIEGWGD